MITNILGLSLPLRLGSRGYFDTNISTIDQVKSNITNLLKTRPGERRFNNKFGSSLYSLLFNQLESEVNKSILIDTIQRDIDMFLNGIYIQNVKVSENDKYENENNVSNSIFININFTYNGIESNVDVKLTT